MTRHIELDLGEEEILGLMKTLEVSFTCEHELNRNIREMIWNKFRESLTEPYKNAVSKKYHDFTDDSRVRL